MSENLSNLTTFLLLERQDITSFTEKEMDAQKPLGEEFKVPQLYSCERGFETRSPASRDAFITPGKEQSLEQKCINK